MPYFLSLLSFLAHLRKPWSKCTVCRASSEAGEGEPGQPAERGGAAGALLRDHPQGGAAGQLRQDTRWKYEYKGIRMQ